MRQSEKILVSSGNEGTFNQHCLFRNTWVSSPLATYYRVGRKKSRVSFYFIFLFIYRLYLNLFMHDIYTFIIPIFLYYSSELFFTFNLCFLSKEMITSSVHTHFKAYNTIHKVGLRVTVTLH